ncbi:MAG: hypothetical protein IJV16_05210 [Lachnospiraceae bacterium]|nr:hypothetical protein [Lachnospiraceae bacterium]MBR1524675.1 hypothetical protein [Lachnospiraceae bacterium]
MSNANETTESAAFLRFEGRLDSFFSCEISDMIDDDFLAKLRDNYTATVEYLESGETAYYVSDENFLHIEIEPLDSKGQGAIIEIACDEGTNISPESYCWIMEATEDRQREPNL